MQKIINCHLPESNERSSHYKCDALPLGQGGFCLLLDASPNPKYILLSQNTKVGINIDLAVSLIDRGVKMLTPDYAKTVPTSQKRRW